MIGSRWLIALSLYVVQGCVQHAAQPKDSEVRAVVDAALQHAESVKDFIDPKQPLLVDVQSFVTAGGAAVGGGLTKERVEGVLPQPFRNATRSSAVRCRTTLRSRACGVRGNALFVQLNSMRRTPQGIEAVATYTWTDRRRSGRSGIGWSQIWMRFEQSRGEWVLRETRVGSTT
jgi:hypothetical protein